MMVYLVFLQARVPIQDYHIWVYVDFQVLVLQVLVLQWEMVVIIYQGFSLVKLLLSALALLYYLVFAHFDEQY